ncbi:MAG TPA: DinB family protein [Gemmatimonadales bacterium]|nr:DinB family protein [Gemmatimonadales bacterium]
MTTVADALHQNRAAVEEFLATAATASGHWTTPRAPKKWSPSQVTEHVARALEQSGYGIARQPTLFPVFPRFVRPIMRGVFFNRMVRTGHFPGGARTNKPMDPESGPPGVAEGRARLQGALAVLEAAALARSAGDELVETTTFGKVSLPDYLVFQAHHTRHHRPQLGKAT